MSTTLNRPTYDWTAETTPNGWNFPPVYTVPEAPASLSALDRRILLATHALGAFVLMSTIPMAAVSADMRVVLDLAVIAYLVIPGIVMAALNTPGREWWTIAAPLVSALYLWLPSTAAGSVHVDAHLLLVVGLATFAPVLNVIAPFVLLAQSNARPWTLAGYGLAAVGAVGLVYASIAYPVVNSVGGIG